jgi:hypothetical protein
MPISRTDILSSQYTQPEVAGGWSIKDIVAHLTGWRRRSVRRLEALLDHEPDFSPPWPVLATWIIRQKQAL